MKENLYIIGISSTAKTIYNFVKKNQLYNIKGFAVNKQYIKELTYCDLPVYAIEDLDNIIDKSKDLLFIAVQWNNLNADRRKLYEGLEEAGYNFANLISPTAIINGELKGNNCWIADFAMVDFGSIIHNNVYVKVGAMIGPNCEINDHSFIGSKSTIGGASVIGEQSFIGLGSIIFDTITVGSKCIVGAGSILKRNLPPFSIYKTSSENYVTKVYTDETIEKKLQFRKNVR